MANEQECTCDIGGHNPRCPIHGKLVEQPSGNAAGEAKVVTADEARKIVQKIGGVFTIQRSIKPLISFIDQVEAAAKRLVEVENELVKANEFVELITEIEPHLKDDGASNFSGYFAHWNEVINRCSAAWPKDKTKGYCESPLELISDIINERDEAEAELAIANKTLEKERAERKGIIDVALCQRVADLEAELAKLREELSDTAAERDDLRERLDAEARNHSEELAKLQTAKNLANTMLAIEMSLDARADPGVLYNERDSLMAEYRKLRIPEDHTRTVSGPATEKPTATAEGCPVCASVDPPKITIEKIEVTCESTAEEAARKAAEAIERMKVKDFHGEEIPREELYEIILPHITAALAAKDAELAGAKTAYETVVEVGNAMREERDTAVKDRRDFGSTLGAIYTLLNIAWVRPGGNDPQIFKRVKMVVEERDELRQKLDRLVKAAGRFDCRPFIGPERDELRAAMRDAGAK